MSADIDVRYIGEDERAEWLAACNRGFLQVRVPFGAGEEVEEISRAMALSPARTQGAFDAGRCVGTFRSVPRDLAVPGGVLLPASAVTAVTVTSTHRRQGLLRRMMANELAAAGDRGDPVAILIASEYPIYGRYGFGPAAWTTEWTVDLTRAGAEGYRPDEHGRVELVDGAEVRRCGPELHERFRRSVPGTINRTQAWWRLATGDLRFPTKPWSEPFYAVYRDASGRVDGLLVYGVDALWEGKMPHYTLSVRFAQAVTPRAEAALWRYALSVDLVTTVVSGRRAPDDVLPLLLGNPRAARVKDHGDYLWLRVLDVVATLQARGYAAEGTLVLGLRDEAGFADGTYRLRTATEPGASKVLATDESPDLVMDVAELATLYLGDESAVRLAALGRVEELRPGAAARADALLRTSRRPWCPDNF